MTGANLLSAISIGQIIGVVCLAVLLAAVAVIITCVAVKRRRDAAKKNAEKSSAVEKAAAVSAMDADRAAQAVKAAQAQKKAEKSEEQRSERKPETVERVSTIEESGDGTLSLGGSARFASAVLEMLGDRAQVAPESEKAVLPELVFEEDEEGDVIRASREVVEDGKTKYIIIKYSKSFSAKLIQSEDKVKEYYSVLKNYLLSYKKIKNRISWKWETFRLGRKMLAKLKIRGKTLSVCLALDPKEYEGSKFHVQDVSGVASYAETPCMYKIKNDKRLRYVKELIDRLMLESGTTRGEEQSVDYVSQYPYDSTQSLIARKLIRQLTEEEASSGTTFKPRGTVQAAEVDRLMRDEVAASLIEKSSDVSDRTKLAIVNIDTLSQTFAEGELVTLDEIKKRVKGFPKSATCLKVLARGTLDKRLIVKADSFSIEAVKMILLVGGKVVKVGE